MFKKIVCPVGLEEESFKAVPVGAKLAKTFGAELFLLHLDDRFMSEEEMVMLRVSSTKEQEEIRQRAVHAKRVIEETCAKLGVSGSVSGVVLREGSKDKDIPHIAEKLGADLIVTHSTGRDRIGEQITGTTSESILKHAKVSVLILFD